MCIETCTRRRDRRGIPLAEEAWCRECRERHEAHVEDGARLASLSVGARAFEAIPPATDEEYLRHLDDIAPRAGDMVAVPDLSERPRRVG